MRLVGQTLFAFVDLKDPFMPSVIAGEGQPGPVLSILAARPFDSLLLFHTPHTRENAHATSQEANRRHPACRVTVRELPVSDPKDYSALMGLLAREVRLAISSSPNTVNHVCVSSGTAEMRTAWFILTSIGILEATLLQIGSPADPLFGAANVKEVQVQGADWLNLRDLVMPREYFQSERRRDDQTEAVGSEREERGSTWPPVRASLYVPEPLRRGTRLDKEVDVALASPKQSPLDDALRELNIFVGSAQMRDAAERAAIAGAESELPILLTGETGTGKEMFAKLIHRLSTRRDREMVCVNCAAIPKDLAESHLFGHVKGAFTGAVSTNAGKFELANGSTLFLDEVGELTLEAQAKLLRVLQDGKVEPVGSGQSKQVHVRIVAATNRNLQTEVAAGRFREDLYYRLEVVQIELPPLRKRASEIPQLAVSLLQRVNQVRQHPKQLSAEAVRRLVEYPWPGNVRELGNVLQRSSIYAKSAVIEAEDLIFNAGAASPHQPITFPDLVEGFDLQQYLNDIKRRLVERALEISDGNQTAAAARLGLTKQAVSKILKSDNGS